VDSAVAATLVHKAVGSKLYCIFVDTGFMRQGEIEEIKKTFKTYQKINLIVVNAQKEFLSKLKGVTEPEKKRKIIGELFIRIFEREAKKIGGAKWLVQGTLYTDAISSGVSVGNTAAVIKSHHNVGGLPEKFGFKLIEPLRELYKDEVRKIGKILGLPDAVVYRQPFPGPGLAVRIIGEITKEKLALLKKADAIVTEEIANSPEQKNTQQYFAVLPSINSVGVQGDSRTYGHPIIIRAISTVDFMTADWAKLSHTLLTKISSRITNEVPGINRVVYDITSKPPATVEWE
jgi:GMP synthase (glutamine-hydrolysing)